MTCMGGSGDLKPEVSAALSARAMPVAAVLSGNRNFESRIHAQVRANYLASPPLVVAYALAGTVLSNLTTDALGAKADGTPVFLADIWPTAEEVDQTLRAVVVPELYKAGYSRLLEGDDAWRAMHASRSGTFQWNPDSTYIRRAPYSDRMGITQAQSPIESARILLLLGDNVTTDHISPVGAVYREGPVGSYLLERGVKEADFNLLLARRANPDVVARTAFSNLQLRNEIVPGVEGGYTRMFPAGDVVDIHEASLRYAQEGVPLVVVAGKNYGAGSSRDTAAKGTSLIGVRAVIAESFERIHRSNLVGLGVLPLQFPVGVTRKTLGLNGSERISVQGMESSLEPRMQLICRFERDDDGSFEVKCMLRVDTPREMRWVRAGGILPYVGNELIAGNQVRE
jgi:aconitate hydratase